MSAKYIIHTVGPAWEDGNHGEKDILRSCYKNSLKLAAELNAKSIAFPLIATGVYGFPKDAALDIALSAIGKFLLTHEMTVILVVFGRASFVLSEKLVGSIDTYLDEHQIQMLESEEYKRGKDYEVFRRRRAAQQYHAGNMPSDGAASFPAAVKPLDQILKDTGDTFQQRLFKLIDASGMDDVTVYKKANIDRKVFSSIKCKPNYKPSKKTAIAFAIALRLD